VPRAIVKSRIKSITYEHLSKDTFCLFESGVGEANLVACAAALDFVTVIPCVPERMAIAKLVVLRVDEMVEFHC